VTTLINYIRPHIDAVYNKKGQQTTSQEQNPQFVITVFKLIYHVTKVRGYKTVCKTKYYYTPSITTRAVINILKSFSQVFPS